MNFRNAAHLWCEILSLLLLIDVLTIHGQVEPATDGPQPLSPSESAESFQLPPGFRMEIVVSEPLIEEPSGVCWDADGHFYVSELHGYNLEGQFDIEALNKTGKLDRIVRRIQANDQAKKAAEAETYGVIKQLSDDNGDGRMDRAVVFAQGLPPCFGMVAAREGIIVVCAPDIYYLADLDDDGVADVRERLFTGFQAGVLERRINAPQWGLDNWIYVGGGGRADAITGPYIDGPVALGRTDFRFKADGSAIEPVAGSTGTFGHSFTAEGDRLTIGTGTPGNQVIPLPWRYLGRNPELSIPSLERNAANYQTTYPAAPPHPWRTRRANDPGFSKYYTDHYGAAESTPSGFFTSACSPFIYRDVAFPAAYRGHNFSCEPAQNLIHHSVPQWEGPELRLVKGGDKPDREEIKDWALAQKAMKTFDLPVPGAWKQVGPLQGGDRTAIFEKDFGPEKFLDLNAEIDGKSWHDKKSYQDGELIDLGLPEDAAVYLYRTLNSEEDAFIYVSLGSNDGIKCWLNGDLLLKNNVNRSLAPDQELVPLTLKKGENHFLMKIVNGTNASGFYFKMRSSNLPDKILKIVKINADQWERCAVVSG
jgi:putative membrane-bound dehydrogenase-like protein